VAVLALTPRSLPVARRRQGAQHRLTTIQTLMGLGHARTIRLLAVGAPRKITRAATVLIVNTEHRVMSFGRPTYASINRCSVYVIPFGLCLTTAPW
jgi:hypothetical protein